MSRSSKYPWRRSLSTATLIFSASAWRGERRERKIHPLRLVFENNEFHPSTQWLIEAEDLEGGGVKTFALNTIHSWRPDDV